MGEQADDAVHWGLGDAVVGWLLAQVGAILAGAIVLGATDREFDDLSITSIAVIQAGMWVGMFGVPWFAARVKGHGLVRDFGLRFGARDPLYAVVGVAAQVASYVLYLPIFLIFDLDSDDLAEPARDMTDRADGAWGVVILVLVVGIGAPIFEEIFYRGLLQRSLMRRMGDWPAVIITAVVFGAVHFQLLQFPALAAFGLVVGVLALRTGRLGPSIFAHMGFNLITVAALVSS
jgi:membrane protease YdiL (CAAX protease family)